MSGQHSYASYQNHDTLENRDFLRPLTDIHYRQVNTRLSFDTDSLNTLIYHIEISARARGVEHIHDMRQDSWGEMMRRRVHCEPILRLVWNCFQVMEEYNITLMEVLCQDPKLMYECMEQGDIQRYYDVYPDSMRTPH